MNVDRMTTRPERRPGLRRELVIALAVKFAAIFVLWWFFFSHPVDEQLTGAHVGATVFGAAPNHLPIHKLPIHEENPR